MALQPRCTEHRDRLRAERGLPAIQRGGRALTTGPLQRLSLPTMDLDEPAGEVFGSSVLTGGGFGADGFVGGRDDVFGDNAEVLAVGCAGGEAVEAGFSSFVADTDLSAGLLEIADGGTDDPSCDFLSDFL